MAKKHEHIWKYIGNEYEGGLLGKGLIGNFFECTICLTQKFERVQ